MSLRPTLAHYESDRGDVTFEAYAIDTDERGNDVFVGEVFESTVDGVEVGDEFEAELCDVDIEEME